MPTFVIVQCYSCYMFLPQQQTKNNKFSCRFCGEKQSIVKVHGRSENAKDLRGPVQQLNAQHGAERDRKIQSREVVQQEAPMPMPASMMRQQRGQEQQGGGGQYFRGRPMPYAADDYWEDGYGTEFCPSIDEEATEAAHRQQHQAAWMEDTMGGHGHGGSAGGGAGGGGGSRWSAYMEEDEGGNNTVGAAGGGDDDDGVCVGWKRGVRAGMSSEKRCLMYNYNYPPRHILRHQQRFVTELPPSAFNRGGGGGGGGRGRGKGRRERGGGRNGGRQQQEQGHGQGEEDGWGGGSSMMEEDSDGWGAWGGQHQQEGGGKGRRGRKRANNNGGGGGGHGYGQGEGGSAWGGQESNKRLHTASSSGGASSSYPGAAPFQSTTANQGGGAGAGNRWAAYL